MIVILQDKKDNGKKRKEKNISEAGRGFKNFCKTLCQNMVINKNMNDSNINKGPRIKDKGHS